MLNFCWVSTSLDILFFNINILWTVNISDPYKKYYFLKEHDEVLQMDRNEFFNIFRLFAEISTNLQKCTILGNLRTRTQEKKMEIRQMTQFFSSTFSALIVCDIHFCIWKLPKFNFMGSSFHPFWYAKYLNFGGVSYEIRIFSHWIQETYTLRK